ncbi:hypothetical protein BDW75DRAFT_181636 [Aspergillus navahoensis]
MTGASFERRLKLDYLRGFLVGSYLYYLPDYYRHLFLYIFASTLIYYSNQLLVCIHRHIANRVLWRSGKCCHYFKGGLFLEYGVLTINNCILSTHSKLVPWPECKLQGQTNNSRTYFRQPILESNNVQQRGGARTKIN